MKRALLVAGIVATLFHLGDGGLRAQAAPDTLRFFKNYFVTGDYVTAGIGLRGKGVEGLATDTISVSGVPAGADIVAAFLYWQVVTTTGPETGSLPVRFNGYALAADNPETPAVDPEPFGKTLDEAGTVSCFDPGASTGTATQVTWTYRADVLRFFGTDFAGTPDSNPNYGKLRVNGAHEIVVPDSGPSGNVSPMALGASLVIVYRVSSMPLSAVVLYDDGVTLGGGQRTLVQSIQGFYQAAATPNARISYLVGSAEAGKDDYVFVPGDTKTPHINVFSSTNGAHWDDLTYPAVVSPGAAAVQTTIGNGGSSGVRDCLTPAALVFKSEVQDTDGDGLLDVWETVGAAGGPTALLDPNGRPLPPLGAMGASPGVRDLFVEIGYMGVNAQVDGPDEDTAPDSVSYGGVLKPPHSHLPGHAALKQIGDAFRNAPVPGGIRVHFDVGPGYPPGDPGDPEANADEYIIRGPHARGGEAIDEMQTVCQPAPGAPEWECQFSGHPGTVGWKSGFRFLRDQVTAVNGAPAPPGFDDDLCGTTVGGVTYACERRFDANRLATFHYALFGHALGLPKSEFPCLSGTTPVAAGPDDRCPAGTTPNPEFHTPRTNTGVGDFPGGDVLITLGGFPDVDGLPVGTPFMQASTLMHEIGHNAERRHGGEAREPNCKPTYLSVMNYMYQLRGLLTDDGMPHLDFSGALGATVNETSLDSLVTYPPYRLGWFAPLAGSYRAGMAQPAARHCNGSDLLPTDIDMVRVDARFASDPLDWDADGNPATAVTLQDVNFSGSADETLVGSMDWPNLLLNQIGSRRNVGGLFLDPTSSAFVIGPLSADVGKGDLGKGDLGKGDLGKGDLGKGDLGKGDLGKGDLGKGDLGKGDLGKGDLGGGDLFLNDPNNPSGELDAETAGDLARTPPNTFSACVIGVGDCGGSDDPLHRVLVTFQSSNTGGNPTSYQVYRVEGATVQAGQTWVPVGDPIPASDFDSTARGIRFYASIDTDRLVNGQDYTYFAVAIHGPEDASDLSNFFTITAVNDPAEAEDDAYETDEDTTLTVDAPGVLGNDSDPDGGDTLTATLVTGPAHAQTFTLNADGSFTYRPAANFSGADSFVYSVGDDTATVTLTVRPVNDTPTIAPVPLPDVTIAANTNTAPIPFTIGDADGPTGLAVSGQSSNTTLVPTANIVFGGSGANRTVTVTPAANQAGSTTITVTVTDGTASAETSFVLTVTKRHTFVAVSNLPPEATKAGSTSPMKWQYEDGAGRLVDSSAVQYAVTVVGPCPTTSVSDPCTGGAVRTITNTDPGGSGFRYINGVWGFNLQTRDHDGTPYPVGFYQLTIRPVTPGFDASPTYPLIIK